jgi:hypothetical protein
MSNPDQLDVSAFMLRMPLTPFSWLLPLAGHQ